MKWATWRHILQPKNGPQVVSGPHPQCPPTSPYTLKAVTWRRAKVITEGKHVLHSLLFFIGPTNGTLYPGPLFLCALAVKTFPPRNCALSLSCFLPPMPFPHLASFSQKLKASAYYYLFWVCVKVPWQENMHMTFKIKTNILTLR